MSLKVYLISEDNKTEQFSISGLLLVKISDVNFRFLSNQIPGIKGFSVRCTVVIGGLPISQFFVNEKSSVGLFKYELKSKHPIRD